MSKRNSKETKKTNNLFTYFPKNSQSQEKSPPPTAAKIESKKKILTNLNELFLNKEKSNSLPPSPKKVQMPVLLKSIAVEQVLLQCPKIAQIIEEIQSQSKLQKNTVLSLLKKFLQSSSQALWSNKYSPNDCSQLFNISAGQKIKQWLNAFYEYKNKIGEEEESYLNDFQIQNSCKVLNNIRENNWQLSALVIKGLPGIGKSSAIRAAAKQMNIDLQQCGNDYNQTKYLKQKNQSTQSQSVKTAISRKVKLQKNAQMITKFMAPIEKQKTNDTRKCQMIHNVGMIFPEAEAQKFYNQLSKCIQLSKIPFIMTNSVQNLPKECEKYDLIEYDHGSGEQTKHVLWAIYHIQHLLKFDKTLQIEKEKIFQTLNNQTAQKIFQSLIPFSKIQEICLLHNYRFDYIFTFLQNHSDINKVSLQKMWLQKYKKYDQDKLINQMKFFNLQQLNHPQQDYKIQDPPTQDSENDDKQSQFQHQLHKLKILRTQDTIKYNQEHSSLKINNFPMSEWQEYPYTCIDVKIHTSIKKDLAQVINCEVNTLLDRNRSSIRPSQFQYLPMIVREKRASRKQKNEANFLKYFKFLNQNQCLYLKQFGHFLHAKQTK